MNLKRFLTTAALMAAIMAPLTLNSAVKDLPVKRVNGKLYHYMEVPANETVYSLCYKLDISKDELVRNNPSVADGLRAGMTLFFPFEDDSSSASSASSAPASSRTTSPATTDNGDLRYKVTRGETVFGIAAKFGVKTDDIFKANPILKNGLKAGQTIIIPGVAPKPESTVATPDVAQAADPVTAPSVPEAETIGYVVKKNETFYSIAVAHGISVAALEAANPDITYLREGQVLNIPVKRIPAPDNEALSEAQGTDPIVVYADTVADNPSTAQGPKEISVAVMLPFMLDEENPPKNALRYTEFYKGLLIAVDSLRNSGKPVNITAYDTEGTLLKVSEALSDSTFRRHTAIIAPDNAAQLAILAEYGRNNGVKVLNTFLVRDESYASNPAVMNGNLPSQMMYTKASDALLQRLTYSVPVFVSVKGSDNDKADFTNEFKKILNDNGKHFVEIEIDGRLSTQDLSPLSTDGNYTFIPTTSRQADLNKIMPGLIEWRDINITPLVRLFGYPEWTTFRGETLSNMHNLNTTVYTRFFTDEDSREATIIDDKFKKWYGTKMEPAVPRQGLLGFDTGMFLIQALTSDDFTRNYDGVQNGFNFTTPDDTTGCYNQTLYFVNFRPGNITVKTRI